MKKLMKKKVNMFGKGVPVFVIALFAIGLVSAALIPYFGLITGNAVVSQGLLVDGLAMDESGLITESWGAFTSLESKCFGNVHNLTNEASVDAELQLVKTCSAATGGNDCDGVTTTYFEVLGYTNDFSVPIDGSAELLEVTVENGDEWVTWTFDFPVETFTGNGNLNLGLIIATDGEGNGPAFQIHNNDGTDSNYAWGTWLMSPWGPTIGDGWHSGDTNTPVTELYWVEAIGQRNTPWEGIVSGDGIMQVRIKKCMLGETFHWAASPTVGSGFSGVYDVSMQIPELFGWATPLVDMDVPNYELADVMEELTDPFTVDSGTTLDLMIVSEFEQMLVPDTYTITTEVQPA